MSLNIANIVTRMTRPDAIEPIIALETTVTGGRTIQAAKRGGKDEARERFIEEATGAVVWIGGVRFINDYIGDPLLKRLFKGEFDVGTDKILRTPFENFMKKQPPRGFSPNSVALIKAAKVLASVVLADSFIGLVVPPLNQRLTRYLRHKEQENNQNSQDTFEKTEKTENKDTTKTNNSNPSFKGGFSAINVFTNAIENTNTGKLLSTDVGLTSGRIYSARNNDERREIAFRDIVSIYFYMWAQGHVGNLLNLIMTGKADRINPNSVKNVHEHLSNALTAKGGEMSVQEFKKLILGDSSQITLPKGIKFETAKLSGFTKFLDYFRKTKTEPLQVAKVEDLKGLFDDATFARIQEMSLLQPKRQGISVVTKQQIIDAMNIAEINDPKFLDRLFSDFTGGHIDKKTKEYIEGASKNEFKYVSNTKLYNLKQQVEDYVNLICKNAQNGKITQSVLDNAKKKNIFGTGINFVAGFATAAIFLSTIIPKVQYWITRVKTGKNEFPGLHEKENKKHVKA